MPPRIYQASLEDYRPFLVRLANRKISDALKAKVSTSDLVQLTFVKACSNWESFEGKTEKELRMWLATILHHQYLNRYQAFVESKKRDVRLEHHGVAHQLVSPDLPGPVMMLHRESIDELLEAIAALPPGEREVIQLRHIEQRPMDEVAQLLGISRYSASRRWKSALKLLGVKLRESEP